MCDLLGFLWFGLIVGLPWFWVSGLRNGCWFGLVCLGVEGVLLDGSRLLIWVVLCCFDLRWGWCLEVSLAVCLAVSVTVWLGLLGARVVGAVWFLW